MSARTSAAADRAAASGVREPRRARGRTVAGGVRMGAPVTVRVPASSANLGPGFDSMGLALALYDLVTVEAFPAGAARAPGAVVHVAGEGAGTVPEGEEHLVVRSIRAGLERAGARQPGLRLRCVNAIPHGKGLGSSAAAIVAGLVAARGLLEAPERLDRAAVFTLASVAEGHPDNAAAAAFGGFVVSWFDEPSRGGSSASGVPRYVGLPVDPRVRPVVCVPEEQLPTSAARAMLPATVPHGDAAFTASRAALLVEALTRRPDLLLTATQERLHQAQRGPAMPRTAALISALRRVGAPAVVSGAGPSILVLCPSPDHVERVVAELARPDEEGGRWSVLTPEVDTTGGCLVEPST
jgi:homoserine kinase